MNENSDLVCKSITGLIFMSSVVVVAYKITATMDYLDKVFCGALFVGSFLAMLIIMVGKE